MKKFLLVAVLALLCQSASAQSFTYGPLPADGYKNNTVPAYLDYVFRPDSFKDGERLSGTEAIAITQARNSQGQKLTVANVPGLTYRLLVDGVPQPSTTVDTTQLPDGTHAFAFQLLTLGSRTDLRNGSRVAVVNNGTEPFTQTTGQTIVGSAFDYHAQQNSLAWGRVDVTTIMPFAMGHSDAMHPLAMTDADRNKLATQKVWWNDGLTHQSPTLWQCDQYLVKNKDGDYFVKAFNPEAPVSSPSDSAAAVPFVRTAIAFDGQRGICTISPYTTFCAGHHILASGHTGFIGADLAGRVFDTDITGEVTTILGPRSVEGVVQTDPDEQTIDLAARIANGEKELVGSDGGFGWPNMPQDIWQDPENLDLLWITDTQNDRIACVSRSLQAIVEVIALPAVTSASVSPASRAQGVKLYAVSPAGLHSIAADNTVTLLSAIPENNGFFTRSDGASVYVLTKKMALYEHDGSSLIQRKPNDTQQPYPTGQRFCFMDIDVHGAIGPTHRIYIGAPNLLGKTIVQWTQPGTWTVSALNLQNQNKQMYGQLLGNQDTMGHYIWFFAVHDSAAIFLTGGLSNSSPRIWTGHLGTLPVPDAATTYAGLEFTNGRPDDYIGLADFFGRFGGSHLGYNADRYRKDPAFSGFTTWTAARTAVRAEVDLLLPASMPEATKENVAKFLWMQGTRKHFIP